MLIYIILEQALVNPLLKQASKYLDKDQYHVFKLFFAYNAF